MKEFVVKHPVVSLLGLYLVCKTVERVLSRKQVVYNIYSKSEKEPFNGSQKESDIIDHEENKENIQKD